MLGSLSGSVEKMDKNYSDAIKREIQEEIGFILNPLYFTTVYHNYENKFVAYHLFFYKFKFNPMKKIKLLDKELNSFNMFELKEALKLDLFEDEDYCLKMFEKRKTFLF